MTSRNGYMLAGRRGRPGYDWWWHSLVGINERTGQLQPFFIEYFVINPALGKDVIVLGQLPENRSAGVRPSYAMVMAGFRGTESKAQIHNYYPVREFSADQHQMNVRIASNYATETRIVGSVLLTPEEAAAHPEFMSDPGEMSWDLVAEKVLSYSVGYGTSPLFRRVGAFKMSWHVAGMLTRYSGTIRCNGQVYRVEPESSCGYQDKNWGTDFTNPWVWLNCNCFTDRSSRQKLKRTSLVVGGARPVAFGVPLSRCVLVAFYHEGKLYEFNFSKFWTRSHQRFSCPVTDTSVGWDVEAWDTNMRIEIHFTCPRKAMLMLNYENPAGVKRHQSLWNGGLAAGIVQLYRRQGMAWDEVGTFEGELGGCEYGEHSS